MHPTPRGESYRAAVAFLVLLLRFEIITWFGVDVLVGGAQTRRTHTAGALGCIRGDQLFWRPSLHRRARGDRQIESMLISRCVRIRSVRWRAHSMRYEIWCSCCCCFVVAPVVVLELVVFFLISWLFVSLSHLQLRYACEPGCAPGLLRAER